MEQHNYQCCNNNCRRYSDRSCSRNYYYIIYCRKLCSYGSNNGKYTTGSDNGECPNLPNVHKNIIRRYNGWCLEQQCNNNSYSNIRWCCDRRGCGYCNYYLLYWQLLCNDSSNSEYTTNCNYRHSQCVPGSYHCAYRCHRWRYMEQHNDECCNN